MPEAGARRCTGLPTTDDAKEQDAVSKGRASNINNMLVMLLYLAQCVASDTPGIA